MNQPNQNNNPDGSGDVPLKRKRGRPRKYPRPGEEERGYILINPNIDQNPVGGENAQVPPGFERVNRNQHRPQQYPRPDEAESAYISINQNISQNPDGGENAQVPPGFERVNRNQHRQIDQENGLNVGQVVSGVIEAVFNDGYLLSVRVPNSDTTLRGLVFKPGRYVPISPENDVAPGVPFIQRNEVPFPSGTYTQVQNPLPKERNEQYVNIQRNETLTRNETPSVIQVPRGAVSSSNLVASLGKNVPSVADQTTRPLARVNVNIQRNETLTRNETPSVIQVPRGAVNSSNLVASLGKNVPSVADQTACPLARGNVNIQRNETLTRNETPSVIQVPRGAVNSSNLVASLGKKMPSVADQTARPLARGNVNIQRNETLTRNASPSVIQVPRGAVSSSNLLVSLGKNVPSVADQTSRPLARGNVMPVLLQPDNLSNGVPVSNQPSQVMIQASLRSGTSIAKEIPVDGNRVPSSQTQTSQKMLRDMQSEDVPHHQSSANVLNETEAKSMRLPSMPFEKMVTEVVKRIQAPSDSIDIETDSSKSGGKTFVKDSSCSKEDKVNDMDQPILIKPLQAVQFGPLGHSASASKPSENAKTGKMTELLQDNKTENQASKAEKLESGHKLNDVRNLGTELEDGETGQSMKRFRASNA